MSVDRDNVIQAFGWFKDLMDADNDAKLAGLSYTLPAATEYDLGGVKVGDGLEMDADDRLNVTISGGDTNVIEAITVDGQNQPVTNKTAALNLSAFAKKTDVANALSSISSLSLAINSLKVGDTNVIESISIDGVNQSPDANKNVNLSLSGYAKKTEVASGVRMKGSVDFFSDLANLSEVPAVGDLYNIKSAGGTDGDGTPILAGDNVVYTDKGTWDVMAGFVDTSRFVEKVAGKQLSSNDFTNADKAKLDSLSSVTQYTLPAATTTERGGIRPGVGLTMRKNVGGVGYTDVLDCTFGNDFMIASATTDGMSGLVPKPYAGQQDEFLKAGAGWHTLPLATKDKKGCVRVGAGLSMAGEDLYVTLESGDKYDVFDGASSNTGGASGLVPSPAAGDNANFLRGDGTWAPATQNITVYSAAVTVPPSPQGYDGALWEDTLSNGDPVLKFRYGDYEFNFNYDTKNYTGTTPPPITPEDAQLYMLDTVPSTDEGTLWYNVTQSNFFPIPALCLHAGSFDYGYNYDTITYKGDNTGLIAYLPLQTSIDDAMDNTVTSKGLPVIEPFTINGETHRGMRNINAAVSGTGTVTTEMCTVTLATPPSVYTVDWWFTVLPKNTVNVSRVVDLYQTGSSTGAQICGYTASTGKLAYASQANNGTAPNTGYGAGRYHVAIVHDGTYVRFLINGKLVGSSITYRVGILNTCSIFNRSCYRAENTTAYCYVDHLRIWNKVVWDGDFEVPKMSDY